MAYPGTNKVINIGIIAHGGAGKTTLVEAILYNTKMITRIGKVEDGNTTTDFEPEEIQHNFSISSALAMCEWKGYKVYMIDTPGYSAFLEDARLCLKAVDSVVVIMSALPGLKAETNKLWSYANQFNLPRVVFVNELDKANAELTNALDSIKNTYGANPLPLQIPLGVGERFSGVVDLLSMKAIRFKNGEPIAENIPDDIKGEAEEYRQKLVETAVETDDPILEKYLEEGEVKPEELLHCIKTGSLNQKFVPVVCGSASHNIGVSTLLDAVLLCLPTPAEREKINPLEGKDVKADKMTTRKADESEPLSAYVFKTIADPFAGRLNLFRVFSGVLSADSTILNSNKDTKEKVGQVFYMLGKQHISAQKVGPGEIAAVAKLKETTTGDTLCNEANAIIYDPVKPADPILSFAISPKRREDEEKVSLGLHKILEEDPALNFTRDEETKEMLLSGTGQLHLEVALEKLKRKFGVEVQMNAPKIPYRETIRANAQGQGKYKKQSGGRGQYGDCWLEMEPRGKGEGFEFLNKIVGGVIPRQYIPAVEKGVVEAMKEGVVAGYPVVDFRVAVYDGSYHTVDSSEMAFKIAASMAFKKIMKLAKPVLLEPIMKVEVTIPDEYLGAIIGDLNSRRAKVQGMDAKGTAQIISAFVPMSEMLTYANQLNSITSAQGMYSMEFSHYEDVPAHISQKIVEERAALKAEKAE
jgi:elongation factor G